jgi:hypothetical protein
MSRKGKSQTVARIGNASCVDRTIGDIRQIDLNLTAPTCAEHVTLARTSRYYCHLTMQNVSRVSLPNKLLSRQPSSHNIIELVQRTEEGDRLLGSRPFPKSVLEVISIEHSKQTGDYNSEVYCERLERWLLRELLRRRHRDRRWLRRTGLLR